jgi:2,3-dihydro-2,3-dihydroxybenzoate dehydrogenase
MGSTSSLPAGRAAADGTPGRSPAPVAVVSGAAGGIGSAVARLLAERGSRVAAVDRDAELLTETVGKLAADGLDVTAYPTDVTDSASVAGLADGVARDLGPADHLVNAAGVLRLGRVDHFGDADWRAVFSVNVDGVFHMCRAFLPQLASGGRGAVVTVASNAAATPRAGMAAYAASKAAATQFTKSFGLEAARYGVRCNTVAPGSTDTPMLRGMWQDDSDHQATLNGSLADHRIGIPLGKIARPQDIAHAVAFLLSDEANHITLHDLTVDGGAGLGA